MGVLIRGAKNAFRNSVRTLSVTLILALSIGLALIMLLSYQTVQSKIDNVKSTIGNTVTITPAGAQGFQGGGEPLTTDELATIKSLSNVVSVTATLQDRQTPTTDTSLQSAIEAGTLGRRTLRQDTANAEGTQVAPPDAPVDTGTTTRTFTIPITITGTIDPSTLASGTSKITSGAIFDSSSNEDVAAIGTTLATKNSLTVGSTFTAYNGTTITVVAIYDAGNTFENAGVTMPLATVQRLSDQVGDVTTITATVNEIGNVDSVVSSIKDKIGSDKVDITSTEDQATSAIAPLENIKNISLYSLIGALIAGAVITLLTMIMIVRERRREIGVLKAIGSSNFGVVGQFMAESLVLTLLGAVVGVVVGIIFSNPVLNALVNSNSTTTSTAVTTAGRVGGGIRSFAQFGGPGGGGIRNTLTNLHATVGTSILLYGLLAAILIALIGSAIPAWLIAKVKPAEVMRGE